MNSVPKFSNTQSYIHVSAPIKTVREVMIVTTKTKNLMIAAAHCQCHHRFDCHFPSANSKCFSELRLSTGMIASWSGWKERRIHGWRLNSPCLISWPRQKKEGAMKMQNRAVHVQGCNLKVCDLSVGPGSHTTDCHKLLQWVVFVALVHASCQKFSATVGLTLESLF